MSAERILVTGAQGFVGRYLVAHLLATDPNQQVVGTGRSPANDETFTHTITRGGVIAPASLPTTLRREIRRAGTDGRYRYLAADLMDAETVRGMLADARPDVIVHNAGALHHADSTSLAGTNVAGTMILLDQAGASPSRLVLVSTGGVYGRPAELPIREDQLPKPIDPYSQSKLDAEQIAIDCAERSGWELAVGRVFNVVGPGQDEHHICGTIAAQLATIRADDDPTTLRLGSLHATRDFIDVRDVAVALALLARTQLEHRIYNLASGCETSMRTLVDTMLAVGDPTGRIKVAEGAQRPHDIPRHYADVARIAALGGATTTPLHDSLADLIRYYRASEDRAPPR